MSVPVLLTQAIDPDHLRFNGFAPEGSTILEVIGIAMPGADELALGLTSVTLVTRKGTWAVPRELWGAVRPQAGVQVVIQVRPGKGSLKTILSIVVSIAALALGQFYGLALANSAFGAAFGLSQGAATSLISLGVTALGGLLINALIPPPSLNSDKEKPAFQITGWRNQANPDGPVPVLLGKHRYAPPFAAMSYSEVVGDLQYVRALFCFGYGPIALDPTTLKIGDTEFSKYDELEYELRLGLPDDEPLTLYPQQVIEESAGVEMRKEKPLDDYGEPIEGSEPVEVPVSRFTASDASEAAVIIGFPGGLGNIDQESGKLASESVTFRIRQRLETNMAFTVVEAALKITHEKKQSFYRSYRWTLPERGRYEIEVTRTTESRDDNGDVTDRTVLVALQSYRPEYPMNFGTAPLALLAVRVKATYQLNGALDSVNGVPERVCPDWNAGTQTWLTRATRSPASLFRYALQSPANAFPVPDSGIDLDALADWHEFCDAKGLEYNRVHDFDASLQDVLGAICAAGRASPRHDGVKWTVVIDRPRDLAVDHISPRNSRQFSWRRSYIRYPDAFRVRFLDETNNYEEAERIIPWPGHVGEIELAEELDLPGITNPDQIWLAARRRQYELIHRPDQFSAVQDGATRVATRGDLVMGSWDVLSRFQSAARVVAVRGDLVELDDIMTMVDGGSYAIRFQTGITEEDTIGTATIRTVATVAGESKAIRLTGSGAAPLGRRVVNGRSIDGDIIHFGPATSVSLPLIVREVEAGENMAANLSLVAAADVIDELLDAEEIPEWNSRVGDEIDVGAPLPAAPVFTSILTGTAGTGEVDGLTVTLGPGTGSTAVILGYEVEHRPSGPGSWTSTGSISEAAASADIGTYTSGDAVDLRARALSAAGEGPWGPTLTVTIGANDLPIPAALPAESIIITPKLGHAEITFATDSDDTATTQVQVYRDGVAVGAPIAVSPGGTFTRIDGDSTRTNLIVNGDFASGAGWSMAADWSIGGGVATKVPGAVDAEIFRAATINAASTYRTSFEITAIAAGNFRVMAFGGTYPAGPAKTTVGRHLGTITTVSSASLIGVIGTPAADGSIDDLVVYKETAACLPQGSHSYELEPQNSNGTAGPRSAPVVIVVI